MPATLFNHNTKAMQDVLDERVRQDKKWGEQNHDPFLYLTILGEEYGETCNAALEAKFGKGTIEHIREEAVQTAAVALAIVECIDRAKWDWSKPRLQPTANVMYLYTSETIPDEGWYFSDEASQLHGPYPSKEIAVLASTKYTARLH